MSIRGNRIGMIFQEPMTSFSPLHTIGDQIGEALSVHHKVTAEEKRERTIEMLRLVEFPRPTETIDTYPFELSGGLRQRAMIAMALICRPALLIADEPTTALDVTVQAQILKLMRDVQSELGMAVLLITHDLGVVANMAEEVVVAHHGKVVEAGTLDDIFSHPTHPYLKALLQGGAALRHEARRAAEADPRDINLDGAPCRIAADRSQRRHACRGAPSQQELRHAQASEVALRAARRQWSSR